MRFQANRMSGMILIDVLISFSLAAFLMPVVSRMSSGARGVFEMAKSKKELLDMYDRKQFSSLSGPYGNDLVEEGISIATSSGIFDLVSVRADQMKPLIDSVGTPLCAVDFGNGVVSIHPHILPIDPTLPLTDLEIRSGVAYVTIDSNVASDPDVMIFNIRDKENSVSLSSLNTGPGIRSFVIAGNRIYAAAASSAYQLQVIRINSLSDLSLESRYRLPLPEASSTPGMASAIFYNSGRIYLGTEKNDGHEFNIIDVSLPAFPVKISGFEIGGKVTDIQVRSGNAYVSSAVFEQLAILDIKDQDDPREVNSISPSGWSRQEGKVISLFENDLGFGRTSGGFNLVNDHELFLFASTSSTTLAVFHSLDIPGGVYGIVGDRKRTYLISSENDREFQVISRSPLVLSASVYPLPVAPRTMTCDRSRIYVLARTAPVIYEISFK